MNLKKITYYIEGKKQAINVKVCNTIISKGIGLMFQKNSPPLLFICKKTQPILITSYFCRPFKAIWLDEKFHPTKIIDVKKWKLNISGRGKYLLEIPLPLKKDKFPTENFGLKNRNI